MESLIKVSEKYQAVVKEDEINVKLFNQFMNKLTAWTIVSREH